MELREYVDEFGRSPFGDWYLRQYPQAQARITLALEKLTAGNPGAVKSVGSGVYELKIDYGAGFRIYFANDGKRTALLLGGGTKKRQQRDIADATSRWLFYKAEKG